MAKKDTVYKCSECGKEYIRAVGTCFNCNSFGTIEEVTKTSTHEAVARAGLKSSSSIKPSKRAQTISEIGNEPISRIKTGIFELDRVLGGGFVDAEVVLFGAAPGTGKSTLSLSISQKFAELGKKVLYSSGEESEGQIGLRAQRMNIDNDLIKITNETNLETLLGHIEEEKPDLLIVDSLQTIASNEMAGSIGSIAQSKEAAHTLTRLAKKNNIIMILINQIVKTGDFSGSTAIQHIADVSLMMESDSDSPLKFLRALKNRFGDTSEVGVFQHSEKGLEEVSDPSGILVEEEDTLSSGTACSFLSEGIRQIPVEVQALVSRSTLPTPRKQFSGVNFQRGQIVCAILDKFCGTKLFEKDVFLSTVSGLKVNDPQSDLAVAAAILSSTKEKPFQSRTAFIGELSLTGMVRGSFMIENKIKEAERLGFDTVIIPKTASKNVDINKFNVKIHTIGTVKELTKFLKD